MHLASSLAAVFAVLAFIFVPAPTAHADDFRSYWVQTHSPTELWSNADAKAVSFGPVRTWSYLEVLSPQDGARHVRQESADQRNSLG